MKFKELLEEQSVEKLSGLLKEKYRNDIKNLIYRGTSTAAEKFDVREIRKDRTARDTPEMVEAVVSAFESNLYSSYPKRNESKFGSADRSEVRHYGTHQVLVFPEKGASLKSLKTDSTPTYFMPAYHSIESVLMSDRYNQILRELISENLKNLAYFYRQAQKYQLGELNYEDWKAFLNKEIEDVLKDVNGASSASISSELIEDIAYCFRSIERYFKNLKENVGERDKEVIFDGKSYLRVDPKYFKKNFMWSGNRWLRS